MTVLPVQNEGFILKSILNIRKKDSRIFSRERKHSVASFPHRAFAEKRKTRTSGRILLIKHFGFYKLDFN
ncbi:hypothetical protein LEP1GSC108_4067 [Leptospira weilii str. UI 13098]|uniref:Uncharacterized protein n=1 Tax=Leptospira weilii str. UI 13098 TaxID=1088542 RepID=M6QS10_9LEPT|nr:hypothetical protein LEP1GSC108_4067 [Leptospira weilii str. UI 13098]